MPNWVCPECRARFPWRHDKKPKCPECGYYIGMPDGDGVVMPFISKPKNLSLDRVYRMDEEYSKKRAEAAAEILGVSTSEMSAMVTTNMKDNVREGDITAITVPQSNPVAQAMQAMPQNMNAQAIGYSSTVSSGPYPNAGARTQNLIRQNFGRDLARFGVPDTNTQSDRPANEISSPLYRPRV